MVSAVIVEPENVRISSSEVEANGSGKCAFVHTPCPSGYLAWHEWAEQMSKTHKQTKCPHCNLYKLWKPKQK